jgi:uncharacterized protein
MGLLVNLRHLDQHNQRLRGHLTGEELDIDTKDEVMQLRQPVSYDLEVQQLETSLLVQGRLAWELSCQCVRCLKPFPLPLELDAWTLHLPLEGEDAVAVVNDCVDLTPYIREDILLALPQHPLCDPECGGLTNSFVGGSKNTSEASRPEKGSAAWDELNKLKF